MKKTILTMVLSLILIFLTMEVKAQQNFQVIFKMPPPGTLNINDLYNVTVTNNSGSDLSGYLIGTAKEDRDGMIAKGTTAPIMFKKGINNIKIKDLPKTPDVEYIASNPRYKESLIRQGKFPSGKYEICVKVISASTNEELGSDCMNQEVIESGLLTLINPADGEEIDSKVPITFSWSSGGKIPEGGYSIKIVEVMKNQTPETAMKGNKAWYEKKGINSTTFAYPNSAKGFEEGKEYAWMVTGGNLRSETFSLGFGGGNEPLTPLMFAYVNSSKNNATINECTIQFSFNHQYGGVSDLYHLKVIDITSNPTACGYGPCSMTPVLEYETPAHSLTVEFNNLTGLSTDLGNGDPITPTSNGPLISGHQYLLICCEGSPGAWGVGSNCVTFLYNGSCVSTPCTDFENGTTPEGWQVTGADIYIRPSGGNPGQYIETNDNSGPSSLFNESTFNDNWFDLLGEDSCGSLNFDIKYTQGEPFKPSLTLTGCGFTAYFVTSSTITQGSGWHTFNAPLKYLISGEPLPSNQDGHWFMGTGCITCDYTSDWNALLSCATKVVRLPIDPTSYSGEIVGYDNICLTDNCVCILCGDVIPPLLNPDFTLTPSGTGTNVNNYGANTSITLTATDITAGSMWMIGQTSGENDMGDGTGTTLGWGPSVSFTPQDISSLPCGHWYAIKHGVWDTCHVWREVRKTIYIDCESGSGCDSAVACLTLKDTICLNDPIIVDGSCSQNETDYFISVQESDMYWNRYGVEQMEWFHGTAPNSIDIKAWYLSKGVKWKCDKYYRVKLAVKNSCNDWDDDSKLLFIKCCDAECANDQCFDFENGLSQGWQVSKALKTVQSNGGNLGKYIETTDQMNGPSIFFNNNTFNGNWLDSLCDSCGSFCFDVKYIYQGDEFGSIPPPITMTPSITISNSAGLTATFVSSNTISVGDGWHSYCAPFRHLNTGDPLPFNSNGHWVTTCTNSQWNTLLSSVTKVSLPVDINNYQNERMGYDNICLKHKCD